MDYKQIDERLKASLDIEFYTKLDSIEEIVFDYKYTRGMPAYEISSLINYSEKTVRRIVASIRCKYMEYINAKEV